MSAEPAEPRAAARPNFLYVGRVTASKGIAALLEDFLPMREYDLTVVGDGDLRATLQQRYADSPHIRFLGPRSHHDLRSLYRHATALILPSLAPETFGLSVIEAFAFGTPAIVRAAGGNRETIDLTGAGYVYESREELYRALSAIAGDARVRAMLRQRARQGYERYYTADRYLDAYLDLIGSIRRRKSGEEPN
jgi:glycosyltransferase involved in cell wall biosynthesis